MALSLLKNLVFALGIFRTLYYGNEEGDDAVGGSAKTVQHLIKILSRNIKAVFSKLGTRTVHRKRSKMTSVMLLPWQK